MSFPAYPSYRDSGVEWLGEVPSHWEVATLKRLLDIQNGADHKHVEQEHGYPVIGSGGQFTCASDYLFDGESVLLGRKGTIDKPLYVTGRFWTVDTMYWSKIRSETNGRFAFYTATTIPFSYYSTNTALPSMTQTALNGHLVARPLLAEQVAIATFLDCETAKIDALIEEQRRLVALLKEKRQAVISHAVTKGLDPHAPMKNSGIEWLGEVPAYWEVKRLRFICHIGTGDADTADAVEDGTYPFFVRSPVIERIGDFSHDCEAVLTAGDGAGVGKVYHHFEGKFRAHQRVYIFSQFRGVLGRFFYAYLSEMFAKAVLEGTAKSTVESLRRPMIADFLMTVPPDPEQVEIISHIEASSAEFDALSHEAESAIRLLNERRAALIYAAVTGKIDVRGSAKVLPFPIERARARALVGTEIIERSAGQTTFGRVKFQKVAFVAEGHVGIGELAGCYTRAAAGPLDGALIEDMERGAHSIAGIAVDQAGGTGTTVKYRLGQQRGAHRQELADWLGSERTAKLDKMIADFANLTTKQAEAVATLYGVWNDLLSDGASPSDDEIITGFLNDWHPEKREKFRASELPEWLGWMRRHAIVPTGTGPKSAIVRLFT